MFSRKPTDRGALILGYTTRRHLILDLDSSSLDYVWRIAHLIMDDWPEVGDCLILQSSHDRDQVRLVYNKWGRPLVIHDRPNHHLIFDNLIGYNKATRICRTLAALNIVEPDYDKIREFRGDMTVRVTEAKLMDETKPIPREVMYIHNHVPDHSDGYIGRYRSFKKMGELLSRRLRDSEGVPDDQG